MQAHVANVMIHAHDRAPKCKLVKPQCALSDEPIEERLMQATEFFFDPDKRTIIKNHEARKAASVYLLVRAIPDLSRLSLKK